MQKKRQKVVLIAAITALIVSVLPQFIGQAEASSVPQFSDTVVRLNEITADTYTGGTACIETPASGVPNFGTENYVDVGFPSTEGVTLTDFTVNGTAANWISDTYAGTPPGYTANAHSQYWPEIVSGTAALAWPLTTAGEIASGTESTAWTSGQTASKEVVRFATTALSASKEYCFDWLDGSGTPGAETSGTYSLETSDYGTDGYLENVPGFISTYHCTSSCSTPGNGTEIESSNWGTQIVQSTNTIVVSAVVPPIFEMSFGANVDAFVTDLNPSAVVKTTGVGVTVATNAKGGWFVWADDQYQGLHSPSAGYTFDSVGWNGDAVTALAPPSPGPALYGYAMNVGVAPNQTGVGTTLCTATPTSEYGGAGTLALDEGGALTANWSLAAGCSTSTPPGTDAGTLITFTELAMINFAVPAASDYTDTIYVTGAGQF